MEDFAGKRALITGAASGIGRATAIRLASGGAQLVIADVNRDGLQETADLIGEGATTVTYDAADNASCRELVEKASTNGLDIMCNIAGVLDWAATEEFTEERFERVVRINLLSVYTLCRAALPHLVESKGAIVNMASTAGLLGIAYSTAYAASKHAIVGLTKSLALEYAKREVRINAVAPGQVNTAMGNQAPPENADTLDWALVMRNVPKLASGAADPADIAEAVAFLASDKARKITGTIFNVDCGQNAG